MKEFSCVKSGEVGERGRARCGREEFRFGKVEVDAMRVPEFLKAFNVEDHITEGKDGRGVIKEGHGGGEGALVVIARGGE